MMPKIEEMLTMCAARRLDSWGMKDAGTVNDAPEIDVHQPFELRLVDLVELAQQGYAGIVDEDVERGMRGNRSRGKRIDLRGLADIDTMRRHLAPALGELANNAGKASLIAVGKSQITAARGQFPRQRAANAARPACHRRGTSRNGRHCNTPSRFPRVGFPTVYATWGARASPARPVRRAPIVGHPRAVGPHLP